MLSKEQRLAIIDRQIAEWEEVSYNAEIAHAVHTKLKAEARDLERFVENMKRAEIALGQLRAIRAELEQAA